MLKFKGKPRDIKCYLAYLKFKYGENATIKEILNRGK
jgi:hypothetical protein